MRRSSASMPSSRDTAAGAVVSASSSSAVRTARTVPCVSLPNATFRPFFLLPVNGMDVIFYGDLTIATLHMFGDSELRRVVYCTDRENGTAIGLILPIITGHTVAAFSHRGAKMATVLAELGECIPWSRRLHINFDRSPDRPKGAAAWPKPIPGQRRQRLLLAAGTNDLKRFWKGRGGRSEADAVVRSVCTLLWDHVNCLEDFYEQIMVLFVPPIRQEYPICQYAVRVLNDALRRFCSMQAGRSVWDFISLENPVMAGDHLHLAHHEANFTGLFIVLNRALRAADSVLDARHQAVLDGMRAQEAEERLHDERRQHEQKLREEAILAEEATRREQERMEAAAMEAEAAKRAEEAKRAEQELVRAMEEQQRCVKLQEAQRLLQEQRDRERQREERNRKLWEQAVMEVDATCRRHNQADSQRRKKTRTTKQRPRERAKKAARNHETPAERQERVDRHKEREAKARAEKREKAYLERYRVLVKKADEKEAAV